jgi:hypothetical protein
MADGRMLAKKISLNEAVASLDNDMHRLLFTWGLCHLDIEGRISGSPKVFRAMVVPLLDHITPEKVIKFFKDATEKGLILRYKVGKDWFIQYPKFKDNQRLRPDREAPSKLPPYSGELLEDSGTTPGEVQDDSGVKLSKDKISIREIIALPKKDNGSALPFFMCKFFEVSSEYREKLKIEYPVMSDDLLLTELSKMEDWISDNRKKKTFKANGHLANPKLFIKNWLNKIVVKPTTGPDDMGNYLDFLAERDGVRHES